MSFKYKMFLVALVAMAPLWGFGNQKYSSSKHSTSDLAAQVQSEISTAAPNAVVVVVDRVTRTAYVTGSSSNQADVDQVKHALQQMTGIRVMGTASSAADRTGSMSSNTRSRTYRSDSQPNANTRSMDASSMGSTNGINPDTSNDYTTEPPKTGMGPGTGSATPTDGSANPSMNHGDSDMRTNSAATQSNSPDYGSTNSNTSNTDAANAGSASTAGGSAAGTKTGSATNGMVSDASLTQSVKDSFKKEGLMGQNKVVVDTRNGIVTLTGTALNQDQADRMVALARQVTGVTGVNNNLQIQK